VYELADCAEGDFEIYFTCDNAFNPCDGDNPTSSSATRLIDPFDNPLPYNQEPAMLTVTAEAVSVCDDGEVCTLNDLCSNMVCAGNYQVSYYGDIVVQKGDDGVPDITDLLCALAGYLNPAACPQADIAPCGGDGFIDVGDVLAIVDGYAGIYACPAPCPP